MFYVLTRRRLQILRPRWKNLYAARRRQLEPSSIKLPALPDTFFGWIPALYRITEDQVLEAAGLDAFVVCCGHLL